jgi:DNA-binding IclR family transcriptional regulator
VSSTKRSAEQAVTDALASQPGATATEIAAATNLGRSMVSKALANLERAGTARRSTGESATGRRPADRWSLSDDTPRPGRSGERLRPGQLDDLVLDYLRDNADNGPLGPTAIARGLGRSSGAVGNCLARLAGTGQVRQVSERPRRYTAV